MLLVVEKPLHAVGRVQLNEYGAVSPTADEVHVNALPDVTPLVGHVVVTVSADPATAAVVEPVAVTALPSLAVLLML